MTRPLRNLSLSQIKPAGLRVGVTVVLVAAIMALSVAVYNRLPYSWNVLAPFDVHGSIGHEVAGRQVRATVRDVKVGPVIKHTAVIPARRNIPAQGQWVVVSLTVTAINDTTPVDADLQLRGSTYTSEQRIDPSTLHGVSLQPGIPVSGVFVFEVPSAAVDGAPVAQLRIRTQMVTILDNDLVIDLPLAPDRAPRMSVVALPVTVTGEPR
ncbi:hypothetical protein [Mycobacteroides salmoniphilum]|uniref:hypothetical protein n=1 Tax=Mycobacteroides salmoniphilum TaxID=404941 RepID=UPI001065F575|nr:hypothetical protein [Mycobacteroides salmoniphilum]TDZ78905.1 hypothetical protein DE4586_02068 [Mycobacteroides salmoniphilum]TDZ86482.1 hypothetical protein DE4587_02448 [Mycobacteroides salmoniphilum]